MLFFQILLLYLHKHTNKVRKIMAKTSLRSKIIGMEPGETLTVPVGAYGYTTLRSYASELGYLYFRKYSTSLDKEARLYSITRHQ